MKQKKSMDQPKESEQHSLVCNDELFLKDLRAIVDDTLKDEDSTLQD